MSEPLPSVVGFCGVKGRFGYARLVAGDSDGKMDRVPVAGLVVTLTPSPQFILAPTATPPLVIVPEPLVLTTDSSGDLRDIDGNTTAYVIGSDDPDLNPTGWTYRVEFSGTAAAKFQSYSAVFPAGGTVDLAVLTPGASSLGEAAGPAAAAAAAAAASAAAAAASAEEAANGEGGTLDASYVRSVIVVTGTEARPSATSVIWIDTREESTRPDNYDTAGDMWATVNGTVSGDVTAPSVPTGLASSSITATGFTASWSASTDTVGVTGYQVRLGTGTPISVSGTSYSFSDLTAGTAYAVTVRARDAAGNWSAYSSALSVTTSSGGDATAPSVPSGLASSSITTTGFTVTWTASTDNVAVTGYEVFIDGTSYATPSTNSQAVTGRTAGTAYSVTVRARDAAGNWSAQSSALSVTTSASGPTLLSRFDFNEGSGNTATSVADGYTLTDMTGGSPVWGSGTIKSWVRGYPIGSTGSALTQWSVAIDFTLNAAPASEGTFWLKDGATQTYFNFTTGRAVKVYGVNTSTSTDLVSLSTAHRLVATQDAATLKVYLDGTEIISSTEQRDFTRSLNGLNPASLDIDIDTFRVWDAALSSGQVSALGA